MRLPVSVLELLLGAFIDDIYFALAFTLTFKITAILLVVLLVRYFLRAMTEEIYRNNRIYRIIPDSLHKNPFKVILILRFIWIPLQIKNTFTGLLTISIWSILPPLLLVEVFYSVLNISSGKMFKDMMTMVSTDSRLAELQSKKMQMQGMLVSLFILVFVIIALWIRKEYYDIQQHMEVNHLLNDHEEDALLINEDLYSTQDKEKEAVVM